MVVDPTDGELQILDSRPSTTVSNYSSSSQTGPHLMGEKPSWTALTATTAAILQLEL